MGAPRRLLGGWVPRRRSALSLRRCATTPKGVVRCVLRVLRVLRVLCAQVTEYVSPDIWGWYSPPSKL